MRAKVRATMLRELAQIPGVYVPSLYETYQDPVSGMVLARKTAGVPFPVRRRILMDINKYPLPSKPIVPYTDIVFDRVSLELFRGCERGCRFCQAGYIYRPTRERNPLQVFTAAVQNVKNSGYEEISLNSLSSGDYSRLPQLLTWLNQQFQSDRVAMSLSSLFASSITKDVIRKIKQVRKTGFTIAPEGGTDRMRKVINKYMSEAEILHAAELAYKEGWEHIKLYFMIGQPTETIEDVEGIEDMPQLRQRFRSFVDSRKATESFYLSSCGTVPTKVLLTKAFQSGMSSSPLVMMEIRNEQITEHLGGYNGNTTFKLRRA
jgi:radical SAM superfamily enzyme YgiQ (UPF0313 family)